ncbi:MAG: glycerol kinase GlpK [Oscillospiraceae bacterium]|jgi:glycerol kinase|nr:glycerol kinase GlpK [Oscillospiraceae bacterium]
MSGLIVAIDQGTTSSRAVVFDRLGRVVSLCSVPFPQIYPHPGWVEHDPKSILSSQIEALQGAVHMAGDAVADIESIGIANQRETTLLWDRSTGEPVCNAIVWQCRRTAPIIEELRAAGLFGEIERRTGLVPDAYFSATKLKWMLDTYGLRARAQAGELCFGTVDTFLMWHMLEGRPHLTDVSNAGRTMLLGLDSLEWDGVLLDRLEIPATVLPEIRDTIGYFGALDPAILGRRIPVTAVAGDQQAALFGQACFTPGMLKNTYGTGCFLLKNVGSTPVRGAKGLITCPAWRWRGESVYAMEGSVFVGGAAVQWLRDELGIIARADETEALARSIADNQGVYLVPAFTGLGAPYWDMYARGTLIGMTRGTGRAQIARATLESIAYQSMDVISAMVGGDGSVGAVRADGGASANGFLMQFQADILNASVERPAVVETTALGAAWMAGLGAGVYTDYGELSRLWRADLTFKPTMDAAKRDKCVKGWHRAVERAKAWIVD